MILISKHSSSICSKRSFQSSSYILDRSTKDSSSPSSSNQSPNKIFSSTISPPTEHPDFHSTSDAKDLILSVLRSTATKREARQYISRYMPLIGRDKDDIRKRRTFVQNLLKTQHQSTEQIVFDKKAGEHLTNQGLELETKLASAQGAISSTDLASTTASLDTAPPSHDENSFGVKHVLRVAIIKIRDIKSIEPSTFLKLGETIVRLSKLGVSPIVVVDAGKERHDFLNLDNKPFTHYERAIMWKAAAIAGAIESASSDGSVRARPVEGLFELIPNLGSDQQHGSQHTTYHNPTASTTMRNYTPIDSSMVNKLKFSLPNLILSPLSQDIIPVVVPLAYDSLTSEEKLIVADDAVIFLVKELTKNHSNIASVEKIVFIDPLGGIPSVERNGAHVYVNLAQELDDITAELHLGFVNPTIREINLANLRTMDRALSLLPSTATGLITTPKVAALSASQNPVIYNILTDRPILSPSLPIDRERTPTVSTTILRKGMPVLMLKSLYGIDLLKESKVGTIDLTRLWDLIEDSFGRKLDVEKYMKRINGKVAGIIIAGDYEGAAIVTWEDPPVEKSEDGNSDSSSRPVILSELERIYRAAEQNDSKRYRRVAYLDKFAVRSSSQGAAGVADVVFKTMVMSLFPDELLWRSRKTNPVNKWYFERSRGTMKLPNDSKWCAFWTGNHTREKEKLNDYLAICRDIPDSWKF